MVALLPLGGFSLVVGLALKGMCRVRLAAGNAGAGSGHIGGRWRDLLALALERRRDRSRVYTAPEAIKGDMPPRGPRFR